MENKSAPNPDPELEDYTDLYLLEEIKKRQSFRKELSETILYYGVINGNGAEVLCERKTKNEENPPYTLEGDYWVLNGLYTIRPTRSENEYMILVPDYLNRPPPNVTLHWKPIKAGDVIKTLGEGFVSYIHSHYMYNELPDLPILNYSGELYNGDPDCDHYIVSSRGGGVKCLKCNGWFCY